MYNDAELKSCCNFSLMGNCKVWLSLQSNTCLYWCFKSKPGKIMYSKSYFILALQTSNTKIFVLLNYNMRDMNYTKITRDANDTIDNRSIKLRSTFISISLSSNNTALYTFQNAPTRDKTPRQRANSPKKLRGQMSNNLLPLQ